MGPTDSPTRSRSCSHRQALTHTDTSGRTQNESGRDGKGESGRDGERESGQDSERESRRDDERAARERVGGTTRGRQEGEREGCRGRVASQDKGTMTMTRPQMRREECVKGENGMVSRNQSGEEKRTYK